MLVLHKDAVESSISEIVIPEEITEMGQDRTGQ
jgi:hypothetical protein